MAGSTSEEASMNVNGVGGALPSQGPDQSVFQSRMKSAFAPVAQLFGETTDQLMSELQSGQTSLSDLAQQKGVSQNDLIDAIKRGLQSASANGTSALSDSQLTNLANRIANHKHGHHHHRPPTAD